MTAFQSAKALRLLGVVVAALVLVSFYGLTSISVSDAADSAPAPAADEINGVVWHDVNADGVNDASELGLAGQLVTLTNGAGAQVGQVITAGDGLYSFPGLVAADGPFTVAVTRDTATYPDPSNWIASGPSPSVPYVGTDQDVTDTGGLGPRTATATGVVLGSQIDAGIRPRPELGLDFFGPGIIDGAGDFNTLGNCAAPGDIAEPGDDCGPSNGQIRTGDVLSTVWSITADNFELGTTTWGDVVFEQVLSVSAGAVAEFERLPVSCVPPPEGTGGTGSPTSAILVDTPNAGDSTLICNLGQFTEGGQESLTVPIKILGESINGSSISTTQRVYVEGDRAVPAEGPGVGPIEISARPAYDLIKPIVTNNRSATQCVDADGDPNTPCETVSGNEVFATVRIAVDRSTGTEALAQPIEFVDNVFALTGGGAPYPGLEYYFVQCVPSGTGQPASVWGSEATVPTAPLEQHVVDSGTCTFSRTDPADTSSSYNMSISGADLSGSRFPTETIGGADLSAGPFIAVEHIVRLFVPYRSIDLVDGVLDGTGSIQLFNQYEDFDPIGVSGISNFGDGVEPGFCEIDDASCDLIDGAVSNNVFGPRSIQLSTGGAWSKASQYRVPDGLNRRNFPGSFINSGQNVGEVGDFNYARIALTNQASSPLTDPRICDVFDNRTHTLSESSTVGATASDRWGPLTDGEYAWVSATAQSTGGATNRPFQARWRIEYASLPVSNADDPLFDASRVGQPGVVDSPNWAGIDTFSSTTGRFEGVWDEQAALRCDDEAAAATGGWVTDPTTVPGGIETVNAVRVVPATPETALLGGETAIFNVPFQVRDTFFGGPYDGEVIPSGTVFANYGAVRVSNFDFGGGAGEWSARNYEPSPLINSRDGDRVTISRYLPTLDKRSLVPFADVDANGSTVAGNQIVWELIPAISSTVTPSTTVAENVQIVDVLPPEVSYNATCTAALNGDPATETILPTLVQTDTDLAGSAVGFTRLTYSLGDLPANVAVPRIRICTDSDPLVPSGTVVVNYAELSAVGDTTPVAARSDSHSVVLEQNGSIQIGKSVDRRLDVLNDDQVYTVRYANFADAFTIQAPTMIDVFPWNGDGPGSLSERDPASDFTGLLQLVGAPTVTFQDGSVPGGGDPFAEVAALTYTADAPATVNYDPDTNTSVWCVEADFGTAGCPASFSEVTAIRAVSSYPLAVAGDPRSGQLVEYTLQAVGNAPVDAYTNRATVDSAALPDEQFLRSNNVRVETVGFDLGDLVFADLNGNGRFDLGIDVPVPAGVTVELYEDANPDPIATTTTDADGRYLFQRLDQGDYYVTIPAAEFGAGGSLEGWGLSPVAGSADPNTDDNEAVDHHAVGVTSGITDDGVRSSGLLTLSATVPVSVSELITGDEPTGDGVSGVPYSVGDTFTNMTLDLALLPPAEIDIEKSTNDVDADTATGPFVTVGDTVMWQYVVTNPGQLPLADVTVIDDVEGVPVFLSGDINGNSLLDVDETWVYELTGVATEGQYENDSTVEGAPTSPNGTLLDVESVTDDDPSHYWGATTAIDIEKFVQTVFDADDPTGPAIAAGGQARFTYDVTNTGNTRLIDVLVTDDVLGEISCPATELAPGSSMTCSIDATAVAGQYVNTGTVVGTPVDGDDEPIAGLNDPTDSDDAHYIGVDQAIQVIKTVEGEDANVSPFPELTVGATVHYVYSVSNVGLSDLTDVVITDDKVDDDTQISCESDGTNVIGDLVVGATVTCSFESIAVAGGITNVATAVGVGPSTIDVSGQPVDGQIVQDTDPATYTAPVPPGATATPSTSPPRGTTPPTPTPTATATPTAAVPATPPAPPRGFLPFTGGDVSSALGLAFVAIGAGSIALVAARRRDKTA